MLVWLFYGGYEINNLLYSLKVSIQSECDPLPNCGPGVCHIRPPAFRLIVYLFIIFTACLVKGCTGAGTCAHWDWVTDGALSGQVRNLTSGPRCTETGNHLHLPAISETPVYLTACVSVVGGVQTFCRKGNSQLVPLNPGRF